MVGEGGPDGKRHVPAYRTGCYHGRIERCCWLCVGRILGARLHELLLRRPKPTPELHALVGTEIVVPVLHRVVDRETVEYLTGRITAVTESDDRPISFGVRLEDGEEIVITIRTT